MKANTAAYLESWASELYARSDRIRQLIGDSHWLSDGHHKEAIIREFLRRHLPHGLSIARGFIRSPAAQDNCSPEIDILLVDPCSHPALFSESDLQVVAPTSVVAHIAVKTTFTKQNLIDALENIARSQMVIGRYADQGHVWRGACFFTVPESRDAGSVLRTVTDSFAHVFSVHNSASRQTGAASDAQVALLMPTCIVAEKFVMFLGSEPDSSVTIRLFDLGKLSFSSAFADLFSAVRGWFGRGASTGELDEMIECLEHPVPLAVTIRV